MENTYEYVTSILEQEKIKYDKKMAQKVCQYAQEVYQDKIKQNRKIVSHVEGVVSLVATLRLDDISIYAALLHEAVKLEGFNEKEFEKLFGTEILEMIQTIHRLSALNFKAKQKLDSENLRKMFMAIAKDIRTVIIKLCDRLDNMQHIALTESEEIKKNMAKECLEIYAPIAHRLGMSKIKSELEDISFRVLYPQEYKIVKIQIDQKRKEREDYIDKRIEEVRLCLEKENIEATVYGRPKHFFSIYKKMREKNCDVDDLFDLLAIRIIVNSVKNCYSALGLVHDMYKPMPGRFKDYIAVPKTNMYQSLHTTVFGEGGKPFEIQIRTWDMHKVAESGIAAHFSYKEKASKVSEADQKIVWLRQTLEIQKELADTSENLKNMKVELFGEEVFVFTPKGDIKSFPKGSTPVDFAYSIHQKIAEKMVGAKINGRMVPIHTKLNNTDIVEVVTSSNAKGPNRDWLNYVKTTSAKNKITGFLKKQGKEINIQKGKELFEKQLRKQKIVKEELLKEEYINKMLQKCHYHTLEDCYENIGFGSVSPVKVMNRLVESYQEENSEIKKEIKIEKKQVKDNSGDLVVVENIPNCKVQFAKCCMPIPGDEIVGYITNSNGVSIHRSDCNNLKNLDISSRHIPVSWKQKVKVNFISKIIVMANTRSTILTDVIATLNALKINICEMNTKTTTDREYIIELAIEIADTQKLIDTIKALKKVESVFEVKRVR